MCVCIHVHVYVYNQCCMVLYSTWDNVAIGSSGNWFYWKVSDLYAMVEVFSWSVVYISFL